MDVEMADQLSERLLTKSQFEFVHLNDLAAGNLIRVWRWCCTAWRNLLLLSVDHYVDGTQLHTFIDPMFYFLCS